jgi:hypothetical protein
LKKLISTVITLIACWQGSSVAQSMSNPVADTSYGVAARSEIYPIPSITISDAQFLQGDSNGKAVQVGGILRYPANPTKLSSKLPVVVLVHGSSGMGANGDYWSNTFLPKVMPPSLLIALLDVA